MITVDGEEYDGEWKNGKPHGKGIMKHADGQIRRGTWHNGNYKG
ncbi:MAG: hypothetical protein R6X31_14925 [Anaerolineae bacterium]